MDQDGHIEELVAQIETHGVDKVLFMLDVDTPQIKELVVSNCQYDGTHVVVTLELA
jgi:hypothetical protein